MCVHRRPAGVEWLVVGLGNPGQKYEKTRHNVGFDAIDYVGDKWNIPIRRSRFDALCGNGEIGGIGVLLMKPQTFMNLSADSVRQAADFYKIPPEHILVLTDDVNLEPGVLRIRMDGSSGGHKGLASVEKALGQNYPRLRIGVGSAPHPNYKLEDWVLGKPTDQEQALIDERLDDIMRAVVLILVERHAEAMSRFNGEKKGKSTFQTSKQSK